MLELMYITNRVDVAKVAEENGVNSIFVDLEYLGKEERQKNLDTVKSKHTEDDVEILSQAITKAELLVRINPINLDSKREIDSVIKKGADRIMLPMFKTKSDVETFLDYVDGRVPTTLLLEHIEAVKNIDSILELKGIDKIHVGLNDLHLSMNLKFMFELLVDGTVETIVKKIKNKGIEFGIGGVGRIGEGTIPAEMIIAEHHRLGSSAAILSRSFCNVEKAGNMEAISKIFREGMKEIREYESSLENKTEDFFLDNIEKMKILVNRVIS